LSKQAFRFSEPGKAGLRHQSKIKKIRHAGDQLLQRVSIPGLEQIPDKGILQSNGHGKIKK